MNYDEALMKKRVADMDCDEHKCAHCGSKIGTQTPVVYDVVFVQPKGHKGAKEDKMNSYGFNFLFFCNSTCADAEDGENCHISNNTRIYNEKVKAGEDPMTFTDFKTYGNKPIWKSEYSFRAIKGNSIEDITPNSQKFKYLIKNAGEIRYYNTMPNDPMEPLAEQNWMPSVQQAVLVLRAYKAAVLEALA